MKFCLSRLVWSKEFQAGDFSLGLSASERRCRSGRRERAKKIMLVAIKN